MGTGSLLMDRHRLEANRVNTVRDFESFSQAADNSGHHVYGGAERGEPEHRRCGVE